MESSRQIEDTAATWIARRDGDEWAPEHQQALDNWLADSIAHRVAFLRLEAAWEQTQRLQALGAGAESGRVPPPAEWRVSPFFEQRPAEAARNDVPRAPRLKWLALAASVLLVAGLGAYHLLADGERYTTPIGGISTIPLQDGSSMILNTDSEVRVKLAEGRRSIRLNHGEAFFDVARDPARPFVVEAGARRILVVGTRFAVRRDGSDIRVVVSDGAVRFVSNEEESSSLLSAGAVAHTDRGTLLVEERSLAEVEELLGWRTGYLVFDEVPLATATAEFNRYTSRRILVWDPRLAALQVSGKFRATNVDAFVRVLREGFGIEANEKDGAIVLTR